MGKQGNSKHPYPSKLRSRRRNAKVRYRVKENDQIVIPTSDVATTDVPSTSAVAEHMLLLDEQHDNVYDGHSTEVSTDDTVTFVEPVTTIADKNEVVCHPEGRRLVALDHFVQQILASKHHGPCDCNVTDMFIINEKRLGLKSILTFKCRMCNMLLDVSTDYEEGTELDVNKAAVLGTISTGIGYTSASELMATLDVPFMAYGTFSTYQNTVADAIHESVTKQIEDNGKEEAELARLHGEVDSDGTPTITVIADGAWSKRSYNVNYSALSGVGCIIGKRTGKILYLAVRNKYCCVCARAETKNEIPGDHQCFKNFTGPSTAMESDIIVEGFQRSMDMHGLKYTKLIGDGDSSVTKKLIETRPYGATLVQKIECSNHLLRNFSKNLREVATRKRSASKNIAVSPQLRKLVVSRTYRLVAAVKKAVEHRSKQDCTLQEQISSLIVDMRNAPSHVFGQHKKCDEIQYFQCEKDEKEINYFDTMSSCGLYEDVEACFQRLIQNAFSLILNMTNNAAEQYNAIVCKFVGGKRINFSTKRSYQTRCEAAALSFNSGPEYHSVLYKQLVNKSPTSIAKKHIEKLKRRKSYYAKAKLNKKQLFRKQNVAPADEHYGTEAVRVVPDLSDVEYADAEEKFLSQLKKLPHEIVEIEERTRGQAGNPLWFQERANRITASNFKTICSMKRTTSCVRTVTNLLYGTFNGTATTRYGRQNEMRAINEFRTVYNLDVDSCGFFIDEENYMLGASPDGLIGDDAIIEIKCPATAANYTPQDAVHQKIIKYMQINEDGTLHLKTNHAYFYQVQGQLHITGRNMCYFVIWTPLGILVEKIHRDNEFWETHMVDKLRTFYFKCLLPEIIDPRKCRGMEIRNPDRD